MAHIVIIGAGLGSMTMAFEMRSRASGRQRSLSCRTTPVPFRSLQPLGGGEQRKREIGSDAGPLLEKRHIDFIPVGVRRVHPEQNQLELDDDRRLDYDFLVVATGPKLAFDEIEGLGPNGHTASICHVDHAAEARRPGRPLSADPGPIVGGAVQGASCFGPAYEFMMIMETDLRRRKIRDRVPMTFVTWSRTSATSASAGSATRRADGVDLPRQAHQVDLQRQGDAGRSRQDVRHRARRGRQAEEGSRTAVQVFDDAAGLQGRGRGCSASRA